MTYFAICIFISAFLLFQVEPMIGKYILPWFGGTPAVWSSVMMFFQVLLIGGYAYAYWLAGKVDRRRESIHLTLLGFSLVLMLILGFVWISPITPGVNWKPSNPDFPIWQICKLLFISVGLPFFLLSTNGPLLQTWFSRLFPGRSPYNLYALSNTGSLIALVSYPVLVEPYFTLPWQGKIWSLGYVLFAALVAYGVIKILPSRPVPDPLPAITVEQHIRPDWKTKSLWVALSACASILLLATTSQVTQEVAVIPFLWVLPLAIYLLSFILAFSSKRWYSRQVYLFFFFIATLFFEWAMARGATLNILVQLAIYSAALFVCCMVCHGELYCLRPHPGHLTSFYLLVSVGGALGGVIVNFVAPSIFKGYWELPLGLALCWLLFLIVTAVNRVSIPYRRLALTNKVLLLSATLITVVMGGKYILVQSSDSLGVWRNFYGVVRVQEVDVPDLGTRSYILVHGVTAHGVQFVDENHRHLPTSYFGEQSGVGLTILNHLRRGEGMRVGVLGLGIGTLAVYGQPGDVYRFYEINPVIIRLAEGEGGYFSYLSDSQAQIEIVPGDARIALEQELAAGNPQYYDVLVLDTFSSDSIPVHLLDREAFRIYLQHLKPDGILAAHISNNSLDLVPVVWTLADHFGLSRVLIDDPGNGVTTSRSLWMLLSPDPNILNNPAILSRAQQMNNYTTHIRLWTDDYSNLFQILKLNKWKP